MKKTGLILEGGATRGVFTAGVLDFLMENEIEFSYVAGVSAGACNAVDFVSKQPGRTKDSMIHQNKKDGYVSVKNIFRARSLFDMDLIFDKYPNELLPFDYDTYFSSRTCCELVVTNCLTGKAEYLEEKADGKRLMDICRASSSLPLLAPMVTVDGIPCLDGGLADSVPVVHALRKGYKKLVVVLTRNKGYRKGISSNQIRACQVHYRRYPELIKTIYRRSAHYNRTMDLIDRLEEEGRIFVIRPQVRPVRRTEQNFERLSGFYQHGYDYMKEQIEALREYMKK